MDYCTQEKNAGRVKECLPEDCGGTMTACAKIIMTRWNINFNYWTIKINERLTETRTQRIWGYKNE